jgi:large subunit ribosomal protein L7/L12
MADLDKLAETLGELTVLEAAELTKLLEEKWGVSAAAPVAVASEPTTTATEDAPEEKSEFNVILKEHGPKKIDVIKAIRQLTSLGLKEAKDVSETADAVVLEAVGKDAADEAKQTLESAGAVVAIN